MTTITRREAPQAASGSYGRIVIPRAHRYTTPHVHVRPLHPAASIPPSGNEWLLVCHVPRWKDDRPRPVAHCALRPTRRIPCTNFITCDIPRRLHAHTTPNRTGLHIVTPTMSALLADLAWNAFRLGFGLFSLASVWISTALSSGTLWARDSVEEKRELAAGNHLRWACSTAVLVLVTRATLMLTHCSAGQVLESGQGAAEGISTCFLRD
jgi:hypothetical protein